MTKRMDNVLREAERQELKRLVLELNLDVSKLPEFLGAYRNGENNRMEKLCKSKGYVFERDLEDFYDKTYDYNTGSDAPSYELKKIVKEGL